MVKETYSIIHLFQRKLQNFKKSVLDKFYFLKKRLGFENVKSKLQKIDKSRMLFFKESARSQGSFLYTNTHWNLNKVKIEIVNIYAITQIRR